MPPPRRPRRVRRVSRNRIELTGEVATVPELRTTPSGTPVIRLEVDCGQGRDALRLSVVMAGADARELGGRLRSGTTVDVTGVLRAVRGPVGQGVALRNVEVVASRIVEAAATSAR